MNSPVLVSKHKSICVASLWLDTVVRRSCVSVNYSSFSLLLISLCGVVIHLLVTVRSLYSRSDCVKDGTENSGVFETHLFFIPLMLHGE